MSDLTVIVPSRGRPHTVAELVHAFRDTCTADTGIVLVIDDDDDQGDAYREAVSDLAGIGVDLHLGTQSGDGTMVTALNTAALHLAQVPEPPAALGFMGDDHRPRTEGWDRAYLAALASLPGIVYGNDLVQGARLPTQCAMSTSAVTALGHMAPPVLNHLYVDNYWLNIGRDSGCLTYLPNVVVEHCHPVAGTGQWDVGYQRVNDPGMYQRDREAFQQYMAAHRDRDVLALRAVRRPRAGR